MSGTLDYLLPQMVQGYSHAEKVIYLTVRRKNNKFSCIRKLSHLSVLNLLGFNLEHLSLS